MKWLHVWFAGHTAATGKIVTINVSYIDSRLINNADLTTRFCTKINLSVPISNKGKYNRVTEMFY